LQTFHAALTDSFSKKSYFINPEIGLNIFRKRNIFFTGGLFADFTVEVKMPVFVCIFVTTVVAEFIFGSGIFLNAVDNSFFLKCF
jgi:hypothetical protein